MSLMESRMMQIARAEAIERSKRSGVRELPGRVPGGLNVGGAPKTDPVELRKRVLSMLSRGPATRTEVCEECGNHRRVRDILDDMTATGDLRSWQKVQTIWYEVAR